jgi:hypothetical protein
VNVGKIDALNFKATPDAAAMVFDLKVDGAAHPERVLIGKKGAHPPKVPFVLPAHPNR